MADLPELLSTQMETSSALGYTDGPLAHAREPAEVLRILRSMVGSRLAVVHYLVPAGVQWPDGRADGLVHEVDHGVELEMENGSILAAYWEMQGESEFLSIATTPGVPTSGAGMIDAIDVSMAPDWVHLLRATVVGVGTAWHIPNAGCPELLWAIRLDFESDSSVVIALGEIRNGVPAYLPDAVLVAFCREDAQEYRPLGSRSSAWGNDVPVG